MNVENPVTQFRIEKKQKSIYLVSLVGQETLLVKDFMLSRGISTCFTEFKRKTRKLLKYRIVMIEKFQV